MPYFTGSCRSKANSARSRSSQISTEHVTAILDRLKRQQLRKSTNDNYFSIWRNFNNFIVRLDKIPADWESRITLFCAYMVEQGSQSSTIASYVSAIKSVLKDDGYLIDHNKLLLGSLTCACRMVNDTVKMRLPIRSGLLELLLFELKRLFNTQMYLQILYQAMFLLGYYGLLRIGELTLSPHTIRACNVHIGQKKCCSFCILQKLMTAAKDRKR